MFGEIEVINLVFLGYAAYFDIYRKRQVNDSLFVLWLLAVLLSGFSLVNFLASVGMLSLFWVCSHKAKIGTGDVFAIGIMALGIGLLPALNWILLSYVLLALFAFINSMHSFAEKRRKINLSQLKAEMKKPYPFFPFMLLAYSILLLLTY